ncbi:TonB-dependent vitamin B12 receptor [Thermomonas sp. HDW16]|uniref:TonB-dependent vitamin B12 receptor n=1 Tax=Thermomonas sp. HDW16 TaxID=2714945 RepID=UPI001407CD63|nr:TonB-dependent vitamin B12 receptor [Thermomonas sp. HDW16]QIL19776.1 TonB-dependent vitamin B12 receptor [Thermomonas sp. HDW16]
MQSRNTLRFTALALALSSPSFAFAQNDDAKNLDNVVVTATRTAITADAALAAVEVIDRKEIEQSTARSLPELLRGRAGVTLVNQGGLGKLSTLFLRGTESDHTLFLVDGIRVGSATSGLTSLQDLPLEQIERIEIVRGPRSSLYGADAIGGVIQVFTRRGQGGEGVRGRARIGAGSNGYREASAGVDLRGTRGGVGIDIGHQSTDGINACRGIGAPQYAGCGMDNPDPDRDGYRNNNASLRADFKAGDAWQFDAHALRARGHNEYDGDPAWGLPDNSDLLQQVIGGSVRFDASEALVLRLTLGRNRDDSDNYLGASFANRFLTTRDSATVQGDITLAAGQLLSLGYDWLRDRADVQDPFSPFDAARGNRAAFAQYQGKFGAHDLQASLRRDDNDQFGGKTTGGIAWGFGFADGWRITASHATAFKAPSFNELYYPYYGNPALRPEAARNSELSLRQERDSWQWQLNAYRNDIDDLIVYDTAIFAANNIETTRIRGIELVASTQVGGWDIRGQLGTLDARNLSTGINHGKRLPRRPQRSARIDLDRDLGDFGVGISGIAEAARWDDVANTLRVGGYGTIDARASWRFAADWTLQASLVNAFDKGYETSAYYNQPGREWGLSLRWQPK